MDRIKTLISIGLGRLHLTQTAQHLHDEGLRVEVIQGWTPNRVPPVFLNILGRIVGSNNLAVGMSKRSLNFLDRASVHSCTSSDFFSQGLLLLNRYGLLSRGIAARLGWLVYGFTSTKHIKNADIFHVRSGGGRAGAIALAKRLGMRVVVDHSIAHPTFLETALKADFNANGMSFWMGPRDPFWRAVLEDCEDADVLLVNSHFVKRTFVESGYPENRIHVIYLGVREDFFRLKNNYRVGERINLLFTGGFGIRKGAQYLLLALEHLVDECLVDFQLTVVGVASEVSELLQNSRIASKIRLVGHVPQENLKNFLSEADIYVFPSLAEGCASSGMEAMAAGLPVIATKESGLPIEHQKDGLIIASKSVEELARSIKLLGSDDALRERLGRSAAKKISENFTWKLYARQLSELYTTLKDNR